MDANEQAERDAKRREALKHAKAAALMEPPDLAPLQELARIEESEIQEADDAADLAERVANAKTAREALKALEPARPYTVDAATWDPGEAPEAVVSVTTSGDWTHPAMRRGEVAALGGAGGSGKSYLALGLCGAAGSGGGHYAGFDVAPGPALVWSREGGAEVAVRRLRRIGAGEGVHVAASPRPLIRETRDGILPTREWKRLSDTSGKLRPALILIDPALAALDIENPDAARPVRRAIERFEALARDTGAAVLLIHHSTKAGRYGAAGLKDMHPDAVAAHALSGSREWFDSPRAAFFMFGRGEGRAEVLCVKANAARPGWCVRMQSRVTVEGTRRVFRGWTRLARLNPDQRAAEASGGGNTPKGNGRTAGEDWRRTAQR